MAETVLQGYVSAQGGAPEASPQEPTSKTQGTVGLYVAFQYPNRNDLLDPKGLPQPIVPPVEIQYVETRFTYDERAATDFQDENIVWTFHQKVAPLGASAVLQDPNEPYDPDTNDYVGLKSELTIRPLIIKGKIYFQMRTVTRSGVPSDWTDIVKLEMNDNPNNEQSNGDSLDKMPCQEDAVVFMPGNNI
jgi:hypothetical protein